MCKPISWVVSLMESLKAVLDGKNGVLAVLLVVLLGGFYAAGVIYVDFRDFLGESTRIQTQQLEMQRAMMSELQFVSREVNRFKVR